MKFAIRKIIKYCLLPFGILYQIFFNNKDEIIILMYHRIHDEVQKELSVRKNHFQWQMNYLKRKNYSVLSMEQAYVRIKNNEIKGKHIVLSFDDGYRDYYDTTFHILDQYELPSILYLVTGVIDKNQVYWWDEDQGKSNLLSWQQIIELGKSPLIEFGSHTVHHHDLDTLQDQQLEFEIQKSKEFLQEKLKQEVHHFSYPRGIYSKRAEKIIKEAYDTAVLIFKGKEITSSFDIQDRGRLKRIPIQRSDGKYLFIARIKGWLVAEEFLRKCMERWIERAKR